MENGRIHNQHNNLTNIDIEEERKRKIKNARTEIYDHLDRNRNSVVYEKDQRKIKGRMNNKDDKA